MAPAFEIFTITVLGLLGGRLLAVWLWASPPIVLSPSLPPLREPPRQASTRAFLDRNLFHAERSDTAGPEQSPSQGECRPAQPPARLVGTVVSGAADHSLAVFAPRPGQSVGLYIGEALDSATIRSIERTEVQVEREGRCEVYRLEEEGEALARPAPTAGEPPALGASVKSLGAEHYEIGRRELDEALGNLESLVGLARVVPAFLHGQAVGFRLSAVRPNSLLTRLGLQNSDLIERINGLDLTSPSQSMELYAQLKDRPTIVVELVRGGARRSLRYDIR